uniref:Uncharacterized protein n=1 Tax=Corvus moneduloides TaxID=1196302 RepID=A0A8U7MSW5_CORMO
MGLWAGGKYLRVGLRAGFQWREQLLKKILQILQNRQRCWIQTGFWFCREAIPQSTDTVPAPSLTAPWHISSPVISRGALRGQTKPYKSVSAGCWRVS